MNEGMLSTVLRAFEAAGWRAEVERPPGTGSTPEALLTAPDKRIRYLMRVKALNANRREFLRSQLAAAAVEARVHAKALPGVQPLAIVGSPRISSVLAVELKHYAERYLPGVAIGWVDREGNLLLSGTHLEGIESVERGAPRRPATRAASGGPFPLFSDLNQWLLKVLLADQIGRDYIEAPVERPRNARHLAKIADVSIPTASRLVAHLRSRSFLDDDSGRLQLVRVPELLELWRRHASLHVDEQALCWILPGRGSEMNRLLSALRAFSSRGREVLREEGRRASLGLFAACDVLGLSHVRGVPPHLYLESDDATVIRKLGLRPCGPGEPVHVLARRPDAPESVFRACVERDGVLVTDAIQCWIDVSEHPSRGVEQSRIIEGRALNQLLDEVRAQA